MSEMNLQLPRYQYDSQVIKASDLGSLDKYLNKEAVNGWRVTSIMKMHEDEYFVVWQRRLE
jgi:hypothetical protein